MSEWQDRMEELKTAVVAGDLSVDAIEKSTDDDFKRLLSVTDDQFNRVKKWMPRIKDQLVGYKAREDNRTMLKSIRDALNPEQKRWIASLSVEELFTMFKPKYGEVNNGD